MTDLGAARLQKALDVVYKRFAAPPPRAIEGCPCCLDTRNVDKLLATPLRALSGAMLWRYVSGAFLTVGGERDFRYLLPRILDISIHQPSELPDVEVILGKLKRANWRDWTGREREAVETLIDAWFDYALADDLQYADQDSIGWTAESVLCGAAIAGLSLSVWLDRLQAPHAAPVLADLRERYPNLSGFWNYAPEGWIELSRVIGEEG